MLLLSRPAVPAFRPNGPPSTFAPPSVASPMPGVSTPTRQPSSAAPSAARAPSASSRPTPPSPARRAHSPNASTTEARGAPTKIWGRRGPLEAFRTRAWGTGDERRLRPRWAAPPPQRGARRLLPRVQGSQHRRHEPISHSNPRTPPSRGPRARPHLWREAEGLAAGARPHRRHHTVLPHRQLQPLPGQRGALVRGRHLDAVGDALAVVGGGDGERRGGAAAGRGLQVHHRAGAAAAGGRLGGQLLREGGAQRRMVGDVRSAADALMVVGRGGWFCGVRGPPRGGVLSPP